MTPVLLISHLLGHCTAHRVLERLVPVRTLAYRADSGVFSNVLGNPDMTTPGTSVFINGYFSPRGHGDIVYQLVDNKPSQAYCVPKRTEYVTTQQGEDMKLLPNGIERKLPPLKGQEEKGWDAIAYVKLFDPTGSWTWYATEYDPARRMFFGLVRGFEDELGYFSLDELESIRGAWGLGIERDIYFKPATLNDIKGDE